MAKAKVKTLGRKLRPSNADRYLNCPASVVASADLPAGESTFYADKGTVVHAVIENCINTGRTPQSYIGELVCEVEMEVDAEMAKSAEFCLEYIKGQGFTHVEAERVVELPWIKNPDGEDTTGKVDFVGYDADFGTLKVGDYKNGYQPVEKDSYQFALYALALLDGDNPDYSNLDQVTSVLVQPNSKDGAVVEEKVWTWDELSDVKRKVEMTTEWVKQTEVIDLDSDDYCEGSWCKFCPLAKTEAGDRFCPKKADELFDEPAGKEAIALTEKKLPVPSKMTREQRVKVLSFRKDIKKWLDDVYKIELANAESGDVPPGMKLVEGRAKVRSWLKGIDQADLIEAMVSVGLKEEECRKIDAVTPAVVKKLLKGKLPPELEEFMTPDEKSTELVSADDRRDAADGSDLFD